MSGIGEERWRGGKGGQGPRRQGSGPKERTGYQDRRDNRPNKEAFASKTQEKFSRGNAAGALSQEVHVPVNNYNAQEVEEALKPTSGMKDTYILASSSVDTSKAKGPWASKRNTLVSSDYTKLTFRSANTMSNGKDFFLELRKQISAARQSGGSTLGG
ncbi:MAG: hypothetical protein Q9160_001788 [Pyrenula sp. 1 TL-2023]